MTINYTTLLGLTEPVTGTQSGTWGSDINTGLTDYVEAAIAGAQVISGSQTAVTLSVTTGSSSAPTTLSQAGSGATGSSQYQIIRCTGNPAGLLTITAPASDKTYVVINATSTSQSVKIVGAGPTTGVTIVSGERAFVAWNGSDFVKVGGAAGGSNTQVQYNNAGVFGGVSGATTNGTAITFSTTNLKLQGSSTGVSSFASANSSATDYTVTFPAASTTIPVATQTLTFSGPTAARTITLPDANFTAARTDSAQTFTGVQTFSSNPILSGGTANGVLYLNGSSVATSGSALTFDGTTFQYTGAANFATSSGNVGIGTSSPGTKLEVSRGTTANASATGSTTRSNSALALAASVDTNSRVMFGIDTNTNGWVQVQNTNSNGTADFIINPVGGNLGLGVTPSAWVSRFKVEQLGNQIALAADNTYNTASVGVNWYEGSGGDTYIGTGRALRYSLQGNTGSHVWFTATSGTAGNAITFTQAMTLDASGNLGIGTTSPGAKLHVYGSSAVLRIGDFDNSRANTATLALDTAGPAGNFAQIKFYTGGSATENAAIKNPVSSQALQFFNGTTQAMTLTAGGLLGVGTTNPNARISAYGSVDANFGTIYGADTSSAAADVGGVLALGGYKTSTSSEAIFAKIKGGKENGTAGNEAGYLAFFTNNNTAYVERARITSGGDFFIGNGETAASPSAGILSATGGTGTNIAGANLTIRGGASTGSGAGGAIIFSTAAAGASGTTVRSASERVRITSDGNLLVGTTSLLDNANYFAYSPGNAWGVFGHANGTASGTEYVKFYYNNGQIGSITQNGTTAVAYNTSSDYRLKENIQPMTGALAKVQALKPCTYKWKADGSDGEGFIAHELAEVCPQAVTGEKDAVDAEGKPVYQGIDTSFLVATLTAAIQEQQALITSLTARVAALEGTQP